jgi:hypothetical protein
MNSPPSAVSPQPSLPAHDTAYYRNVSISLRGRQLVVVDPAGREHVFAAHALAWVSGPGGGAAATRLLVLDGAGAAVATVSGEGWDLHQLWDFCAAAGVPLLEESYADDATAQVAHPLAPGALRIHSTSALAVVLQFLPVLLPVLLIIILAALASL